MVYMKSKRFHGENNWLMADKDDSTATPVLTDFFSFLALMTLGSRTCCPGCQFANVIGIKGIVNEPIAQR